jgi:hypothetical protein
MQLKINEIVAGLKPSDITLIGFAVKKNNHGVTEKAQRTQRRKLI